MSKFHGIIRLMFLISLALINNVQGDCTNRDGTICTGTDCCYNGANGIPTTLGSIAIDPVQSCYTSGSRVTFTCNGGDVMFGPPFNDCTNGAWGFPFGPTCEG